MASYSKSGGCECLDLKTGDMGLLLSSILSRFLIGKILTLFFVLFVPGSYRPAEAKLVCLP